MKKTLLTAVTATLLGIAATAQVTQPIIPRGKLAVFKAGNPDNSYPMITARVAPCYVQVFDPATANQTSPLVSIAMATNSSVPGSVWINHHAGSEGGGISRSIDRQFLCLEGYTGNILSPTASKPSTDPSVTRGIVTLDAFTNAISVYSSLYSWFGIPPGAVPANNQDNPTGIASTDGTNFWGTGNFAGTSSELDGTLYYNSGNENLQEVQQFIQAAGEARIIGGMLLIATKSGGGSVSGLYNFIDPSSGAVVPLPWDPNVSNPYYNFAFTNLYMTWGNTFKNVLNFDMDPARTVAYGADQQWGIIKFTNNSGTWVQAPYFFNSNNIGTTAQAQANQGCFGICVDFSGPNPIIYATTMENGAPTAYPGGFGVNTAQGHQNNNRLIRIVDTGVNPGSSLVAQTLAVAATTNEFFGGIDFTPDLTPVITSQPANYATTNGGAAFFSVAAQSVYALDYQWLQNGTNLAGANNATLNLSSLTTSSDGFTYQCVVTNNYGAVTSIVATLNVTLNPVAPHITSGTNHPTGFVGGTLTFPAVTATGTQPFTYQWYNKSGVAITDDGVKYLGSATPSLTISNLATPGDSGNYWLVVANPSSSVASNIVDVLTVNYKKATITAGQPASVTTFVGTPTALTATQSGATPPVTSQWYKGATQLADAGDYTGTTSTTLNIAANSTADSGTNYYIVFSNGGGSVTSVLASVTVLIPPAHSSVLYSNQVYRQFFDGLPDPGTAGVNANGTAVSNGLSVNSINNPGDPGVINSVAYSLANPFDFAYPVINNSYIGGLGLGTGANNLNGWYGAADTNLVDGVDGITRFGAQNGDQSTGGVIDFGLNDQGGGIAGTNRALGLLSTSTTGSTSFGVKLVNGSASTLNYINLSFLGQIWRNNTAPRTMSFSYLIDSTATNFSLISEPEATNTMPQVIPGTIPAWALSFNFPTNPAGVLALDGNQPANRIQMATNNMALGSPWTPGGALWLIWSINFYGQGTGQGYAIDNLSFSASVAPITAPALNVVSYSGGFSGSGLKLGFSDSPGAGGQFTVWSTTNVTLPFGQWQNLGHPSEITSGNYVFTDNQATNKPQRYYRVTSP
ncbi:MAG: hypothetical protein C5B50_04375 [Verrucomicrobia bacterium]|nr:MAG: hypothetical protein C5B50_04375 [Verrucomicrobiota bacterium]